MPLTQTHDLYRHLHAIFMPHSLSKKTQELLRNELRTDVVRSEIRSEELWDGDKIYAQISANKYFERVETDFGAKGTITTAPISTLSGLSTDARTN